MNLAPFPELRARFALLTRSVAGRFSSLRLALLGRLAAAHETAANVAKWPLDSARGLTSRAESAFGPKTEVALDRVHAALVAPGALAAAARAYLALSALGLVVSFAGAPAVLVALLSMAQGALKLALAAAVVAPAFGHFRESAATRAGLRALRVGAAVGLLWLAGVSFAPGQAVYPRPAAEAAAPATTVNTPPFVAARPTARGSNPDCRASEPSPRQRRRVVMPAGLS